MLFNTLPFMIFFPVVTLVYYLLPFRWRWCWLLAASCFFYMWFKPVYILILLTTIVIDYTAGLMIERNHENPRRKRAWLVASVVSTLSVLFIFKYQGLFRETNILLPIGLSFHTFQSLSYVIEVYRGNRYAAAALMAKAMLWAGCVAKYNQYTGITGPATDAGLMGMDPADAKEFFQYAYDACKFIHDAGFRLHTGADKEKAYTEIFIEDLAGEEDIFVKTFGTPNTVVPWNSSLYSSYDDMVLPKGTGMAQSVGAAIHATWDLVSLYETPAIVDADGYPVRFDSYDDFWNTDEMEPRCRANFFFSGMVEPVSGTKLDIQQGVFTTLAAKAADLTPEDNNFVAPNCIKLQDPGKTQDVGGFGNVKITGVNGIKRNGDEGFSTTGIFVRKYMNYKADPATRQLHQSTQSWKVFRYGEILMDWAEAAYELGLETGNDALKAEAFEHVNEIRARAGAHPHEMVASPADIGEELYGFPLDENLQYIRDERRRELCIENQGEWDQRRWRTAHSILASNYWPRTLMPYKVLNEDKYIFLNEVEVYGRRLSFDKRNYYEAIPGGEINKNPKLVRNDGY